MARPDSAAPDINSDISLERAPAVSPGRQRKTRGRRGNAEGSIYQRTDGRWVAAVTGPEGRRVYRYARTRVEAAAKLTLALKLTQDGLPVPPEKQTVADFLNIWLRDSARPAVRPSTYVSYETIVRRHIVPELGRHRLSRLTPEQVQAMLKAKLEAGLTPRRVTYIRSVLRQALGQALRWGLVGRNVAALVRPPRAERYEVRPLDLDQTRRFLAAVRGDRLEALFSVAVALGLRQGEALGLRWEDVDLARGVLHVRKALQKVDGSFQLVEPKTLRSRRTLTMPEVIANGMRAHRDRQVAERLAAGNEWEEHGLVFTTIRGRPLDASNVTHAFQRRLKEADLPRQRFHDLRHACATLLLAEGVNPRVVMEILGHSQITLTMDTYSHVLPRLQQEAAARMNDLLEPAS